MIIFDDVVYSWIESRKNNKTQSEIYLKMNIKVCFWNYAKLFLQVDILSLRYRQWQWLISRIFLSTRLKFPNDLDMGLIRGKKIIKAPIRKYNKSNIWQMIILQCFFFRRAYVNTSATNLVWPKDFFQKIITYQIPMAKCQKSLWNPKLTPLKIPVFVKKIFSI